MGSQLNKGQAGIEFVILVGIVAIISIMIIGAILFYLKQLRGDEAYYDLKDTGDIIRNEVYMAASVEDGYSRSFFLGNSSDYNITGYNKSIVINGIKGSHVTHVEVEWIGNFTRGWNNISKFGGVIYVN